MYVCGPTVYDEPHIGHARSAYIFDVIRRYLAYRGYSVLFVRNVTDVDDKIIDKARKEYPGEGLNAAVKKVSQKYLDDYQRNMDVLGVMRPDKEPKATEYVSEKNPAMQRFIKDLIERGAAYVSGGDVYFDIRKAKNYGKLSNQSLENIEAGARVSPDEKKNDPLDFALWKAAKEGEPSWPSPWGNGRPGWHIECSVMSSDILGDEFDIHGGGIDLIFPHHENEIAQSEGAGKHFARAWIHNGLLTINGQKMAKSLGNFVTIQDFLKMNCPDLLKIFFLSAHYSHPIDYTAENINEAKKTDQKFELIFRRTDQTRRLGMTSDRIQAEFIDENKRRFMELMDDDFNMPRAMAALLDLVGDTNKFMDREKDNKNYTQIINCAEKAIEELGSILGLFQEKRQSSPLTLEEKNVLNERDKARASKDFALADKLRKELLQRNIIIEDTKDGTTWRRKV